MSSLSDRSPERLLLMLGSGVAVAGGIVRTVDDFERTGLWTMGGLRTGLLAFTAVWILFGVLSLARSFTERAAP